MPKAWVGPTLKELGDFSKPSSARSVLGFMSKEVEQGRLSYSGLGASPGRDYPPPPKKLRLEQFRSSRCDQPHDPFRQPNHGNSSTQGTQDQIGFRRTPLGIELQHIAEKGFLRFEVTSEGDEVIEEMEGKIKELCEQYSLESDTKVDLEVVAKRQELRNSIHPSLGQDNSVHNGGIRHFSPKVDLGTVGDLNALIRAQVIPSRWG